MIINGANISGVDIYGNPALYDFSTWTFTNGNSTGTSGPTVANLRVLYNTTGNTWINNDAYFSTTNGIQLWTVPQTGTYTITARGASSGMANVGLGASIAGTFTLNRGEIIRILVGQMGGNTTAFYSGGGGGSFVVRTPFNSNASILTIAGGAGGVSYRGGVGTGNLTIAQGSATALPGKNVYGRSTGGGGGGATWDGGLNGADGQTTSSGWAGGGGGFFGNGATNSGGGVGGKSFTNGGTGGTGSQGNGGFGGGGGAVNSGGGGGGYNGGQNSSSNDAAAGAGSYNSGTSQTNTANANLGHGSVTITFVSAD